MSIVGMPSVMHTARSSPASAASITASAPPAGGTKMTDAFAPVAATASVDGVEHRPAFMRGPAFPRRDAADDVGAVRLRGFRVKRPLAASQALDEEARGLVDQHRHSEILTFAMGQLGNEAARQCNSRWVIGNR